MSPHSNMAQLGLLVFLATLLVCHGYKRLPLGRLLSEKHRCDGVGMQPHPHNCRAALLCGANDAGEFVPQVAVPCPLRQAFSTATNTCELAEKVPDCNSKNSKRVISKAARATCSGRGTVCVDCNTVGFCFGADSEPFRTFTCPTRGDTVKYCNTNSATVAYCGSYVSGESCPSK
ncbi:uncharacterized protein LOC135943147 [Cloeon dipterum]|uniref:uncharacterized protein LOC135943147 n=1 Tax=Cloeon dipterum TaxID=197152 RepID=UPI00321FB0F8